MPRKKRNKTLIHTDCACHNCAANREFYGETLLYCTNCGGISDKVTHCNICDLCNGCKREYHYKCHKVGCGKSVCHKSKTFCERCIKCLAGCCECVLCRVCHRPRSLKNGMDGCFKCKLCINCGVCPCGKKENFSKIKSAHVEFKRRTSVADIVMRDGTAVNKARVAFHTSAKTEFKLNSLKRYVSTEIEIAGLNPGPKEGFFFSPLQFDRETLDINIAVENWRANLVEDMSLPGYGFEINTAPANGDKFVNQVTDICDVLAKFGATTQNNYESRKRQMCCGLHVHADARDFFYNDMQRFLLLYEHIEDAVYALLPGYRRASHFAAKCGKKYGLMVRACRPIPPQEKKKSPDPVKQGLITSVYDKNMPDRSGKRVCPQETRYRSVNLHQYFYRGTIEFRHFYGTVDKNLIINWSILVGAILDYAQKESYKTISENIQNMSGKDLLLVIAEQVKVTDVVNLRRFLEFQWLFNANDYNEKESPLLGEIEVVPDVRRREPRPAQARVEQVNGELRWVAEVAAPLPPAEPRRRED